MYERSICMNVDSLFDTHATELLMSRGGRGRAGQGRVGAQPSVRDATPHRSAAWSPDFTFFLSRPVKGLSFTTCARVDVLQPIYYIYTYVFITWWGTTVRCGTNPAAVVCAQTGGARRG